MSINPLLDTIMNIEVFLFIDLMVWLYFKPDTTARQDADDEVGPSPE